MIPFKIVWTNTREGTVREWRSKFEGSEAISVYFSHSITYTNWKIIS